MSIVTPSPVSQLADRADPVDAIVDFARGFSLEATRPSAEDVAVLAAVARPGTRVYVSAVPTRPAQDAIEAVASLRAAGFEPVPHLAVRNFATARELDDFLARVGDAGVRCVLVIAGDRDQPSGDFRSSIEVIDGGALQRHGIVEIGIAGYPMVTRVYRSRTWSGRWQKRSMSQRRPGWRCTSSPSSASIRQRS
jgi:methylenetetrahydrofolate reductase (NADPH)